MDSDGIEALLSWAKDHPAAVIRNKAARVRSDLHELTARREADDAQREAEVRVAKLKAELEQAQETLRTVKAGGRPAATAAASAPTATKRSKEQLAAIRTWARQRPPGRRPRPPGKDAPGRVRRCPPHHHPGGGELRTPNTSPSTATWTPSPHPATTRALPGSS
ncbi:hypothetical protein QCN29_30180 [Streptomyces sp. HNM0663]|uniref:Transposase n=1 Tax=Streptomyces chengmaiensis TaxID=3040919 RepID=A0ABT6HX87_9ACTN|nr:hypothetical protein [Streptomyces chengmaiensis]MDH2392971.1 hypothetical protein [Streptomyces chengmaiensis]